MPNKQYLGLKKHLPVSSLGRGLSQSLTSPLPRRPHNCQSLGCRSQIRHYIPRHSLINSLTLSCHSFRVWKSSPYFEIINLKTRCFHTQIKDEKSTMASKTYKLNTGYQIPAVGLGEFFLQSPQNSQSQNYQLMAVFKTGKPPSVLLFQSPI